MKVLPCIAAIATANSDCMLGWGDDSTNCYPQNVDIACTETGMTIQLSLSDMYEYPNLVRNGSNSISASG